MKICIDDNCYSILRVVKNGVGYEQQFLENIRNNYNGDVIINDNAGNILICKRMLNYELNTETNKWVCVDPKSEIEEEINADQTV